MAPAANTGFKSADAVAEKGSIPKKQKHRQDNPRAFRRRNVTEAEKRVIRELYAAGYTGLQIEQMTGIGHTAVYRWIGRTRASTPTWTDEELQILIDGYWRGWPVEKIAKKVGRSKVAVRIRMHRYRKALQQDIRRRKVLQLFAWAAKNRLPIGRVITLARKTDILGRWCDDI